MLASHGILDNLAAIPFAEYLFSDIGLLPFGNDDFQRRVHQVRLSNAIAIKRRSRFLQHMATPAIFADPIYIRCIELAQQCSNDARCPEQYGSVIVQKGDIFGEGRNRAITHKAYRLERIIRQGWVNHAEVEALNDALEKETDVNGADLYVAGFFFRKGPRKGKLFFQQQYTCSKCIPHLKHYGISNIHIAMPDGWRKKSLDEAIEEAKSFKGGSHSKRMNECIGNYTLSSMKKYL